MSDQQVSGLQLDTQNPSVMWGLQQGERTWPTARVKAGNQLLGQVGLADQANAAIAQLQAGDPQASIDQLQQVRAQLGQQVASEPDIEKQRYAYNALRTVDRAINEAARVKQAQAADQQFTAQKEAYDRQRIQNAIDGTPITAKDPGSEFWHNTGNTLSDLWQGAKRVVPYFYDEWGNPESSDYARVPPVPPAQATTSPAPTAQQPTADNAMSSALALGKFAQDMGKQAEPTTATKGAKSSDATSSSSSVAEQPVVQQSHVTQPTAPARRVPGTATGLHYEALPDGGFRYGDQVTDQNGYQSTFMPQVNVARNPQQQIAWNNLMRQANASYNQNRAATLQEQAKADLLTAQADPATYQLADQYAKTMGLNAQEALNLATTERARAMGMWGAASMSTAPTQQGLDTASQRNVGMGAVYGVDAPTQMSSMGYSGVNGMRGMTFNNDGTVNVDLGGGKSATGISTDTMTRMLAAGMNPQSAAQAAVNQSAQKAALQARIAATSYGSDGSGLPTGSKAATSIADKVMSGAVKDGRKAAGASAQNNPLGNM